MHPAVEHADRMRYSSMLAEAEAQREPKSSPGRNTPTLRLLAEQVAEQLRVQAGDS